MPESNNHNDITPDNHATSPDDVGYIASAESNEAKLSILDQAKKVLRTPYTQGAILASAFIFAIGGNSQKIDSFDFSGSANEPTATLTIHENQQLKFEQWQNFKASAQAHIDISPKMREIINSKSGLFEQFHINPENISDKVAFKNWVEKELRGEAVKSTVGKNPEEMNAKDLVEASAVIVIASLKYEKNRDKFSLIVKSDQSPIDQVLMQSMPAQCETYTASMISVFNELKLLYPEALSNTYVVPNESYYLNHVWNAVIQVTSPDSADISFIDSSAEDPDWGVNANPEIRDLATLIGGLLGRNVITSKTAKHLSTINHIPLDKIKWDLN